MRRPCLVGPGLHTSVAGAAFLFVLGLSSRGLSAPDVRTDFPCKGCLFFPPPAGATNSPLLVVLHGDAPGGKRPLVQRDAEPFVAAAIARGIAVLAPACPRDQGCLVGSYWQWTQGDPPAWLMQQVDAVRKEWSVDESRVWIAGWSGGASFLGYHYPRFGERFGAVIFAGGGMPPYSKDCAPCTPPAYFLVGDQNPLHHLAKDLKTRVLACSNDVTWDLLPGKDHAGEWRALKAAGKVGELLDWLAKHPRNCPGIVGKPPQDPPLLATSTAPSASAPALPAPSPTASALSVHPNAASAGARGCSIERQPVGHMGWFVGLIGAGVLRIRRGAPRRIAASFRQPTQ